MFQKYSILLLIALLFIQCKSDEINHTLALSVASITVPEFGMDYSVVITTSASQFTATSDAEWCNARVDVEKSVVVISVPKNRLYSSRKAKILVKAGDKSAYININQDAAFYSESKRDSVALVALNNGQLKWNLLQKMDTWDGVKVELINGERRVIELNLPQKNYISGNLSDSIVNLTELRYVDLSGLNLIGNLPALTPLTKLIVFDAKNNKFNGSLPQMPLSIAYLSLGQNNFNGELPIHYKFSSKLQVLDLGLNNLTGSIPAEWTNLLSLKYLFLHGNVLSGSIPTYISFYLKLEALALDYNQFTGSIPNGLGSLKQLSKLYLQQNKLTGSVPLDLLQNSNWQTWKSTVINQQNGAILDQPLVNVKANTQNFRTNRSKVMHSLPDKSLFICNNYL